MASRRKITSASTVAGQLPICAFGGREGDSILHYLGINEPNLATSKLQRKNVANFFDEKKRSNARNCRCCYTFSVLSKQGFSESWTCMLFAKPCGSVRRILSHVSSSQPTASVFLSHSIPGILCGWSGRLEQSATGHSFRTYNINFQKHAQWREERCVLTQDTSFLTSLLHWLTFSIALAANIVRRPCSDSSHVTAHYK